MTVLERWAELLGRVQQANDNKKKEKSVPPEEAKRLVDELLASPESRAFFASKLSKPDELIKRKTVLTAAVEAVRDPERTKGWPVAERNNLMCYLTDAVRKASPNWAERRRVLWQVTAAWCDTKDFRIQQEVGDAIKELAGVTQPNLRAALRESDGWDDLSREERANVLLALKEKWPTDLRYQAEEMITALRALPMPPPRPSLPPPVIPPTVAPAAVTAVETEPAAAVESHSPLPAEVTTKPAKAPKKKPEPPAAGDGFVPLLDGLKQLVEGLNTALRERVQGLAERVGRLEQADALTLRTELERLRSQLSAVNELYAEERTLAQQLERELADARERVFAAERELATARRQVAAVEARTDQDVHEARLREEAAINGFRARLWSQLRPRVAEAGEPGFVDSASTPNERVVCKHLKEIHDILQAEGVGRPPT